MPRQRIGIGRAIATLASHRRESLWLLANHSPNKRTRESLHPHCVSRFNGSMKAKILLYAVVAGSMLHAAAFGQSLQLLFANVTCITSNQIEVQCDGQTWVVKLTPGSTTLNPPSPTVGSKVTIQCKSPDAQRKESPTWTPSPCTTSKPAASPRQ